MTKKFNDNLNVLHYGNLSKLESTMNHHFLDQLNLVSDESTQDPKTIEELNEYIKEKNFTHVLIPDEHFHNLDGSLKECIVPVVELLGDHWVPWAIDKKRNYVIENGIKHVIVFSKRFQDPYKDIVNLHAVLQGYNNNVFRNRNLEREIDILIHGSLGEDTHKWVYPVRNWLAEILPEIGIKEGLNVQKWKHPGYFSNNKGNGFIEEYSDILNKSKIAIGGSSYWRLPLKKFYETPACGAILLSDLPLEDKAFFENKIIEINPKKIKFNDYKDVVRRGIMDVLKNYKTTKKNFQPFNSEQGVFNRSYEGKALEIRKIISTIN